MNLHLLLNVFSIVLIDLLLAGDNAVVIALAVKTLPHPERRLGVSMGAGLAVALRILLTFFAAKMLQIQFVKMAGGALIVWIAVKLLADTAHEEVEEGVRQAGSVWAAMWYIVVADVTMSMDNILAVAGTSKGNLWLLVFGLGLSIPFVVLTSTLLARIMDRWPLIVWIGAAILGRVGGEMIIQDPWFQRTLAPPRWLETGAGIFFAAAVLAVGGWASRGARRRVPDLTPDPTR
jgi:YjbE family integral membrane protein